MISRSLQHITASGRLMQGEFRGQGTTAKALYARLYGHYRQGRLSPELGIAYLHHLLQRAGILLGFSVDAQRNAKPAPYRRVIVGFRPRPAFDPYQHVTSVCPEWVYLSVTGVRSDAAAQTRVHKCFKFWPLSQPRASWASHEWFSLSANHSWPFLWPGCLRLVLPSP